MDDIQINAVAVYNYIMIWLNDGYIWHMIPVGRTSCFDVSVELSMSLEWNGV